MYNKKTVIGYSFISAGIITLLCLLLFIFLGYKSIPGFNIDFEPEQTTVASSSMTEEKISIPGFETWTIDAGKTKADSNFYNPEQNTCYFVISVTLDDSGEEIYKSKYIKPGQRLYEVELSRALSSGKYKATVHYNTFSVSDYSELNGADVPFELVVR